jgi:hypothetical protein
LVVVVAVVCLGREPARRWTATHRSDSEARRKGRVLIEELPARRCLCGAPLFRLERDGRSEWVRCLAGHGPFAQSPGDYEAGEPVASAYPHPWGWQRTDGYRPVTRAVACPSQPRPRALYGYPTGAAPSVDAPISTLAVVVVRVRAHGDHSGGGVAAPPAQRGSDPEYLRPDSSGDA